MIEGKVTPPDDLQPAIDALGPMGRKKLLELIVFRGENSTPLPKELAQAADYGRLHGEP